MGGITKMLALFGPVQLAMLLSVSVVQGSLNDERLNAFVVDKPLSVQSSDELEVFFTELDYVWPMREGDVVPALVLDSLPKDLASVSDVKRKKALFFRALLPLLVAENERLLQLRGQVLVLFEQPRIDNDEQQWLAGVAKRYRVSGDLADSSVRQTLLRRLDGLPPALALVQAANESAWGTSRFSRLANNLFGQWTYNEAEGLVPLRRPEGATYAVRKFATIEVSVQAYMHNLNTHGAYHDLRLMRERMRIEGREFDAIELATGLLAYSSRGEAYVKEIQAMIRGNRLLEFSQTPAFRSADSGLLKTNEQNINAWFADGYLPSSLLGQY